MKTWKADLALVGVTLIWGSTFVMVKTALGQISTLLFLALRFTLAAAVLALLYRNRLQLRKAAPALLIGLLLFTGYVLQTLGLRLTTPSKSAFLTGLAVPLVPLAAALVYWRGPRWIEWISVAMATLGMTLLTMQGERLQFGPGDLLSFGCAVAFALHVVAVGHFAWRMNFQTLAVTQIATAAVLGATTFAWAEPPRVQWTPGVLIAVCITGLFATALAFTVQAWAQRYTTPTRTALIFALEPVCASFTSYWVTGETLSPRGFSGAVLILFGILLAELKRAEPPLHP